MAHKTALGKIVRDHLSTFSDVHGRRRVGDYIEMYLVPVALGGIAVGCNLRLHDLGDVVSGISILAGLLFGLLVYVFQLRLQLASDPRVNLRGLTIKLIEQLFSNVAYAVVAGLLTAAYLVACANIAHPVVEDGPDLLNRYWSGGVVALSAHLMLTIFMCLKRTRTAFVELLKARAGEPIAEPAPSDPQGTPPVRAPQ